MLSECQETILAAVGLGGSISAPTMYGEVGTEHSVITNRKEDYDITLQLVAIC